MPPSPDEGLRADAGADGPFAAWMQWMADAGEHSETGAQQGQGDTGRLVDGTGTGQCIQLGR